jgi:hypothetical protein
MLGTDVGQAALVVSEEEPIADTASARSGMTVPTEAEAELEDEPFDSDLPPDAVFTLRDLCRLQQMKMQGTVTLDAKESWYAWNEKLDHIKLVVWGLCSVQEEGSVHFYTLTELGKQILAEKAPLTPDDVESQLFGLLSGIQRLGSLTADARTCETYRNPPDLDLPQASEMLDRFGAAPSRDLLQGCETLVSLGLCMRMKTRPTFILLDAGHRFLELCDEHFAMHVEARYSAEQARIARMPLPTLEEVGKDGLRALRSLDRRGSVRFYWEAKPKRCAVYDRLEKWGLCRSAMPDPDIIEYSITSRGQEILDQAPKPSRKR